MKTALAFAHSVAKSPYPLWVLMAYPALPVVQDLVQRQAYYPEMMHISGVWATIFLVICLAITPALLILKNWDWGKKLGRLLAPKRRHLGVASFFYAALHTIVYVRQMDWDPVVLWLELADLEIVIGWLAFFTMLVLAAVSNQWGVRKLGKNWKPVQRFSYFATVMIFLHWYLFNIFMNMMWQWLFTLALIKLAHIALRQMPKLSLFKPRSVLIK